jgi:hypothetical protein
MSTHQQAYRQFCASAPADFPVFMQDWYLDAVCEGGTWEAAIHLVNGETVAGWPYFMKNKLGWRYVAMPLMGKFMGPYIVKERRNIKKEMQILESLLTQLPSDLAAFQQDFNYTVTNWLPLYWKGFSQTTRYSYIIPLAVSERQLWDNLESDYRRKIKKAGSSLIVRDDLPAKELYRLCALSFDRQSLNFPLSYAYFEGIYLAFESKNAGKAFFAVDSDTGLTHSAIFLIWDQSSAYFLWGGDDPALRSSASGIFLQWHAILYAKNTLQLPTLDFEGSMIQSIERGRRYFGAVQKPYFRVRKEWSWLWKWGKFLLR